MAVKYCTECGAPLEPEAEECPVCGKKMQDAVPEETAVEMDREPAETETQGENPEEDAVLQRDIPEEPEPAENETEILPEDEEIPPEESAQEAPAGQEEPVRKGPLYEAQKIVQVPPIQGKPHGAEAPELVPMTTYLWMSLVAMIPVAGIVFLLIQSFGEKNGINRRNFARGFLIARLAVAAAAGIAAMILFMMLVFTFPFLFFS